MSLNMSASAQFGYHGSFIPESLYKKLQQKRRFSFLVVYFPFLDSEVYLVPSYILQLGRNPCQ